MSHFSGKLVLSLEIRICSGFYKVLSKRRDKGQIPIFSNSWDFCKVDATVLQVLDGTVKWNQNIVNIYGFISVPWISFDHLALWLFSQKEKHWQCLMKNWPPCRNVTQRPPGWDGADQRPLATWRGQPLPWTKVQAICKCKNTIAQIQIHNKNINTEYAGPEKTNTNTHDVGLKLKVCTAKYINLQIQIHKVRAPAIMERSWYLGLEEAQAACAWGRPP